MPLLDNELARREGSHIVVADAPMRIACELADLPSADGFGLRCWFRCSVRAGSTPADRVMLAEVLLAGRKSVLTNHIAEYFTAALAGAAARAAGGHEAGWWLGQSGPPAMLATLRKAAEACGFSCGIEILDPISADLTSPDYQRQQIFTRQAKLAEQRAAEQIEHLHRSAELLREFHALRDSAPGLSPGAALEQLSPADRGSILQSLLHASASDRPGVADRLFAVAGPYLAQIDAQQLASRPILHPLPGALGPLRSVQSAEIRGQRRLLVGARAGFFVIDPADPADAQSYAIGPESPGDSQSALGFNRVVHQPESGFWATHAELGLVNWADGDGNSPRQTFGPSFLGAAAPPTPAAPPPLPTMSAYGSTSIAISATGPRNLIALAGDAEELLFSIGPNLFVFSGSSAKSIALPGATGANVAAIVSDGGMTAVIGEDGSVYLPDSAGQWTCRVQRGSAVCAAGLLPWLGSSRLLLATVNGPIDCVGVDDPLVTQYSAAGALGARGLAASSNSVAAISRDRQRLLLWHTWDSARPAGEIYLGAQAHHRIADVAFA